MNTSTLNAKTTYRIIHYTNDNQLGADVYRSDVFRKTELQEQFDALVSKIQDGESAEYMKEDSEHFYPSMQYVYKDKGKYWMFTPSGHRKLSTRYNP